MYIYFNVLIFFLYIKGPIKTEPLPTRKRDSIENIEINLKKIREDVEARRNSLDSISSISDTSFTKSPIRERAPERIVGTIDLRSKSRSLSPISVKSIPITRYTCLLSTFFKLIYL